MRSESGRPSTHEASYRKQAEQLKRLRAEKTCRNAFTKAEAVPKEFVSLQGFMPQK